MEPRLTFCNLLKKVAEEQKYADYSTVQEDGGSNITSSLFHAVLRASGKSDLKLFGKVAAMPDLNREVLSPSVYTIELFFYTTLQDKFRKLEESTRIPEEYRIRIPKLYGSNAEYHSETLVLEDLNAEGFQKFDNSHSADMELMTAGIQVMARFHALSMAYHKDDPEGYMKTKQFLTTDLSKLDTFFMSTTNYNRIMSNALAAAGEHRAKLEKYFVKRDRFRQIMDLYRTYNRNIIVHGDFKPSNLMCRRRNGKLELAVVDFQRIHDGNPIGDLFYFIFTATDEQFRREHYNYLLDVYYQELKAAMLRLNLDPELVYSQTAYRAQLEDSKMLGLVMAVALLPAVFAEEAVQFPESDTTNFMVPKAGSLFKERFNGVLNNYVEWGLL